jgi:uncharacterized protein YbcV (DUF1398 family)
MDTTVSAAIRDCAKASAEGRISFADVVRRLGAAGIERYAVDYVRGETVYYLPDGSFEAVPLAVHARPAEAFSATGVAAAVRGAQSGALTYPAFCREALAAGCTGYLVSLAGRRVVYSGRSGDSHVEWFPGAGPSQQAT